MKCPKCGANLGKLKTKLVALRRGEETFNPRETYAQIVKYESFKIYFDGKVEIDDLFYFCPICGVKFKQRGDER